MGRQNIYRVREQGNETEKRERERVERVWLEGKKDERLIEQRKRIKEHELVQSGRHD